MNPLDHEPIDALLTGTDSDGRLRTQRAARWAGGLFLFGAAASLAAALFIATSWQESLLRGVFAIPLLVLAVGLVRMPWGQWPLTYLAAVVPVAFGGIFLHEWLIGFSDYTYAITFVLVYVWVGLALPRWTPWGLSPLLVLAYVLPKLDEPEALKAGVIAIATCVLVGEAISFAMHRLRRYRDEFSRRAAVFHRVARAAREITSLDSRAVVDEIVAASRKLGFDAAMMIRVQADEARGEMISASGLPEALLSREVSLDQGIMAAVIRTDRGVIWYQREIEREGCALLASSGLGAVYAEPVHLGESISAILLVGRYRAGEISMDERAAAEILTLEAEAALTNAEHFAVERRQSMDYRDQSLRDALTGLGNRRLLEVLLERLAPGDVLLLIDLDHFKWVNDSFGHDQGDSTLVHLAEFLRAELREGDVAIRHGGEEFVVVMPAAGEYAEVVAQRLLERWRESEPITTFSMGLAIHRPESSTEETLKRADEALYAAKRDGRNRLIQAH